MRLPGTRQGNAVTLASALQSAAACGKVLGSLRTNYVTSASVFVVQFNGFMSLTGEFDVTYSY